MKGKLYFEDQFGKHRLMEENVDSDAISKSIVKAIKELNPSYQMRYMRTWCEDGISHFDVGSHSEFFLYVPEGVELPDA